MNENQLYDMKQDFRAFFKKRKHTITAPASRSEFEKAIKNFNKEYKNKNDFKNALTDVSDMLEREFKNHTPNIDDDDLILIRRPNNHLHIANYDEAVKYLIDGHITL